VVSGKKSGKASVTYRLEKLGIHDIENKMVANILMEVKKRVTEKKELLTLDEFKKIVESITG
jgi:isopropylmalate/homocitrate/citramalate synthase